jgi:hypothetical protein
MSHTDKQSEFDRFLDQLPSHMADRLARALGTGASVPPHAELLEALRPQLHPTAEPTHHPTPQRSFCRPFEDLLVNKLPDAKQKGRIARESIGPVWAWLEKDLLPEQHKAFIAAAAHATAAKDEPALQTELDKFWVAAAAAMRPSLDTPEKMAEAARVLGSTLAAEDAAEMTVLISAGTELRRLLADLPRTLKALGERETALLRAAYDSLSRTHPDAAPYVAVIAMARLERPWEALHLAAVIAHASDDTAISGTDVGMVGDLLFSDLDRAVSVIGAARPAEFDPDTLMPSLAIFAELSAGMVKEIAIRRHGKWGQHLMKARTIVAEAMEGLLVRAHKEITAALPPSRGGYAKGPKVLDLSRAPDAEKHARAVRFARVVGQSKPHAAAAAFQAKLSDVREEIAVDLRAVAETLLRDLRAERPGIYVTEYLSGLLELSALVLGDDETDLVRRRARASARR